MESINTASAAIHFEKTALNELRSLLEERQFSKIFILVDEHTRALCLPRLRQHLPELEKAAVLEMPAGEEYKHLQTCQQLWEALSDQGADRSSLLLNLGGGVVCDLGGFVAATFKRGIAFAHLPTTLLAMVDASVGGKTGVDLGVLKNQVGVIQEPLAVYIWSEFLQTLPDREVHSGYAEMLKHGLIGDRDYWDRLKMGLPGTSLESLIRESVNFKARVVREDPKESGLRKILNFGHTLGHAIESYFLDAAHLPKLLHGEAIAIGMVTEAYLSTELCGLPEAARDEIRDCFARHYPKIGIGAMEEAAILELLVHDKKNKGGQVNFVLLREIGEAQIDVAVPPELLTASFAYYKDS